MDYSFGEKSRDAVHQGARRRDDQFAVVSQDDVESSFARGPRRTGVLACDHCRRYVRPQRNNDPLVAKGVGGVQPHRANSWSQAPGWLLPEYGHQHGPVGKLSLAVPPRLAEVIPVVQCRQQDRRIVRRVCKRLDVMRELDDHALRHGPDRRMITKCVEQGAGDRLVEARNCPQRPRTGGRCGKGAAAPNRNP